jgi:hypothetical protein
MVDQRVVKLGVSGHRFLHDVPVLEKAMHAVLSRVSERYAGHKLEMYNPLAPGADQLAAAMALQENIPLIVLLPLPQEQYLEEFPDESREVFFRLMRRAQKVIQIEVVEGEHRYRSLANYLIGQMDLLVAVWNGLPARGPGGTGEVVEGFRHSGKPLAWVRADNMHPEDPMRLPPNLLHGSIQYENW